MIVALNIMSKKIFPWKKSNKLATDASVLDENDANDSSDRAQSNTLSISPLSPEMGVTRSFDNNNMSVIRTNDLLPEPSNALSLNSTQQNIIQFSHINHLHFGTSVQINAAQPSERRSTGQSTSKIQKTTTIDSK